MRIAISGTSCIGKTTLIGEFLKNYPTFTSPKATYRDLIKNDTHSSKTNEENQWNILNSLIDNLVKYEKNDNVIFDRCPIDNLVYSLWKNAKSEISEEFIQKSIEVIRESLRKLDIIFYIPINSINKPVIEKRDKRDKRENNLQYITEIDNIFKEVYKTFSEENSPFCINDDKPAVIEIYGSVEERLSQISLYVKTDGTAYGEEDSLVNTQSILEMETLLNAQKLVAERAGIEDFKKSNKNIRLD